MAMLGKPSCQDAEDGSASRVNYYHYHCQYTSSLGQSDCLHETLGLQFLLGDYSQRLSLFVGYGGLPHDQVSRLERIYLLEVSGFERIQTLSGAPPIVTTSVPSSILNKNCGARMGLNYKSGGQCCTPLKI